MHAIMEVFIYHYSPKCGTRGFYVFERLCIYKRYIYRGSTVDPPFRISSESCRLHESRVKQSCVREGLVSKAEPQ